MELTAAFLQQGLDKGERCVFFTGQELSKPELARLGALIPGMDGHRVRGRLMFCTAHLGPDAAGEIGALAAEAGSNGHAGLRVVAEMSRLLTLLRDPMAFPALCEDLDRRLARMRVTLLSQFREDLFPPELIFNVLKRHSVIVIGDEVFTNSAPVSTGDAPGPRLPAAAAPRRETPPEDLSPLLEALPFPVMAGYDHRWAMNDVFRRLVADPSLAGRDILGDLSGLAPDSGETRQYTLSDGRTFSFSCVRAARDSVLRLTVGRETAPGPAREAPPARAYHASLLEALPLGYLEIDGRGRVLTANARAASLLVCPRDCVAGRTYLDLVHPLDRGRVALWLAEDGGTPVEARLATRGRECWVRFHTAPSPRPDRRAVIWEDINDRKKSEVLQLLSQELVTMQDRLQFLSTRDALTGLFNRQYFEEEISRLKNPRFAPVSVLIIDVDGLKPVNDSFGHPQGDELLRTAARVLKKPFRDTDMVARIGGDEFAVILPHTSYELAKARREDILRAVHAHNLASEGLPLSLSIGVATADTDGPSLSETIKRADDDMYRCKLASNVYVPLTGREAAARRRGYVRLPGPAGDAVNREAPLPG